MLLKSKKDRHVLCIFFLQVFCVSSASPTLKKTVQSMFLRLHGSDYLNCFKKYFILFIPCCWALSKVEVNRAETSPSQGEEMKTN